MKTVLVTGATGFIGSHTIDALLQRGRRVVAVARRPQTGMRPDVSWEQADVLDRSQMNALLTRYHPDELLHLAWYVEPGKLITHPDNVSWVGASLDLVRAFREAGGNRCVISGSCYEYDWRYGNCVEDVTPCTSDTLYGTAKDAMRRTFEAYCKVSGLSGAWGRAFFLYGPRENPNRLVSSVIRALLEGREAPSSHGLQVRDYLHVQDVADGLVALLDSTAEGSFNIASAAPVTIRTIVEKIGVITGRSDLLRIGALPPRANDAPMVLGDVTKMATLTGWRASRELTDGLTDTVRWWTSELQRTGAKT